MKTIFLIVTVIFSLTANAQVKKVSIQASGLTCSMCSNAIHKALQKVDFVERIDVNIKTSTFEVFFKPNSKIDFDKLRSRVEDAGFFVSKFIATVYFDNVPVKAGETLTVGDKSFHFLNTKDQALDGDKALRIVDKGFLSVKEYKKNAFAITNSGAKVYHVVIS